MITFQVKPDGGEEFEVTATSRDVYVWERTGRGRSFSKLMEDPALGDLYSIAHIASRRQQLYAGTLEEFTESCDITSHEEDAEPDPTRPAR